MEIFWVVFYMHLFMVEYIYMLYKVLSAHITHCLMTIVLEIDCY